MKTKPEKVYQLVDPDTWEVVGEITRKELVKKYGAGTYGTITKVGRLLLATDWEVVETEYRWRGNND